MGYESKFFFVKDYGYKRPGKLYTNSSIIAEVDVSKMGDSDLVKKFLNSFDKEIPFNLYISDYDEETDKEIMQEVVYDKYGKHLCYCSDKLKSLELLYKIKKTTDYDRIHLLYDIFKSASKMDEIYIVHYGY